MTYLRAALVSVMTLFFLFVIARANQDPLLDKETAAEYGIDVPRKKARVFLAPEVLDR